MVYVQNRMLHRSSINDFPSMLIFLLLFSLFTDEIYIIKLIYHLSPLKSIFYVLLN